MRPIRYACLLAILCSGLLGLAAALRTGAFKAASAEMLAVPKRGLAEIEGNVVTPVLTEQESLKNYQQALAIAKQAVVVFESYKEAQSVDSTDASSAEQLELIRRELFLWKKALVLLAEIPSESALHSRAIAKQTHYKQLLTNAERKLAKSKDSFISQIIQEANIDPQQVHITVCRAKAVVATSAIEKGAESSCHHHQGTQPLASAASLIKVPIALALAQHAETHQVSLSEKVFIEPGNFTENSADAVMEISQDYPLRQVMGHMLSESDNIATNQLIDYLGYDNIEQALAELGYEETLVGHKLVGDRIKAANFGTGLNQTSTNDITTMMAKIYRQELSESPAMVTALAKQADRELGYEALKGVGSNVEWLGEKTGQNDRLLASTVGMSIRTGTGMSTGTDIYVLTVALDNSSDVYALRQIIQGIANHISKAGI